MHPVDLRSPLLETEGLLFHVAVLGESIPDGPLGVFISNEYVKGNPVLRTVIRNDVHFKFVAFNPGSDIPANAPMQTLLKMTGQPLPSKSTAGRAVRINLYAEWVVNAEYTRSLLESAIGAKEDPPEVTAIAEQVLSDGFDCCCEFVDILRRKYLQSWLIYPYETFYWAVAHYYSRGNASWYSIIPSEEFSTKFFEKNRISSKRIWPPDIVLRAIDSDNASDINNAPPEAPYSFAEEIIATSLIELSKNRIRSAILHAVIALEASAKRALGILLTERLNGFEDASILEAIAKEVSVATLARVVYHHIAKSNEIPIDWVKIDTLYDTRNTIVHRGQRRVPNFETTKGQLLEVFNYVQSIESALRESQHFDEQQVSK